MKIKKGDKVLVIAGNSKGTSGEVLEVFPAKSKVVVEGANLVKKHQKPTNDSPGGIIDIASPIHISNVKLVDPKTGDATRVGRRVEDGKIVRFSKSTGETIK
ncbi:MAG: 50S ribosomal protein L24 [Flavobacteriales bacterium]|nr:50S ribosomal protein L24 [Flavobacteriales bacterium]